MPNVDLERIETGDQGTFGILTSPGGFQLYCVELPWRDNKTGISCIPPGTYTCAWRDSPKHGFCYYVMEVKDRMDVEIHSANWAGDKSMGWYCQLEGCIAPGRSIQDMAPAEGLKAQRAVTSSRDALTAFEAQLAKRPFSLTVRWRSGVGPAELSPAGTPT